MGNFIPIGHLRPSALMTFCVFTVAIASPANAQVAQMELDAILHQMTPQEIAMRRSACAMGLAPKRAADIRAAGIASPDASAWCVTILTRAGRDGTLGYVRDPRSEKPTPAIAFDSGFVGGYSARALPQGAPSMATLLPIVERCLGQREPNTDLCNAAGQVVGERTALGEEINLR